jgi:predicted metalloendopeptidase
MEHHKNDKINYFKQLEILLTSYNISQLKEYFKFHIILAYMDLTSEKMREIYFNMFKKTIKGQKKSKPLWRLWPKYGCDYLFTAHYGHSRCCSFASRVKL